MNDAGLQINFANHVVEIIDGWIKRDYPKGREVRIVILAYMGTEEPPVIKDGNGACRLYSDKVKPHASLYVEFSPINADFTKGLDEKNNPTTYSNLKKWNNAPTKDADEIARRIQISLDYLENDRTELDLVYEIMLKYGIDLTLPITKTVNEKAYIVEAQEYKLLICSEMNLKLEDIEEFANESVGTYLFADRCFSDDNLLINTQEILKSKNKEMRLF